MGGSESKADASNVVSVSPAKARPDAPAAPPSDDHQRSVSSSLPDEETPPTPPEERGLSAAPSTEDTLSSLTSSEVERVQDFVDLQAMEFYKMMTMFEEGEIRVLHQRFRAMDRDASGVVFRGDMAGIPEFAHHPLRMRIVHLLELPDLVDFETFLKALSTFAYNASREDKTRFAFRVWDVDGDGVLNESDLFTTVSALVGDGLEEDHQQQVVSRIVAEQATPLNELGHISYDTFVKMTLDSDIHQQMTFPIL